ncbi:MAG: hypothetical protein AABX38_05500 [Candidatus Micrarchaeota archaeon]
MKKITLILGLFLFLALPSLVFSSSSYISYARLTTLAGSQYYIDTDLTFNNAFSLTQSGDTIQNNGAACPGSATVGSTSSATWPSSGSNFGVVSPFPACGSNSCPITPPSTNSVSTNNQIVFLSQSTFATALNSPQLLIESDPEVSMFYNGMSSQTVNYIPVTGSNQQTLTSRLGKVGVYCTGTVRTSVTNPSGQTQVVDEVDVTQQSNPNIQFTQNGRYTITTQMRNVQCIGATLKQPENDGYFYMYVYSQSPLTVTNLPSDTKTITVQNQQVTGQVSGVAFPAANSNIQLAPGASTTIMVPIQNTGNTPFSVTNVAFSSFSNNVNQLTVAPTPNYPSPPCFLGCSSNFNSVIQPGQTQYVFVTVSASQSFSGSAFVLLLFTLSPTQGTCSQTQPGTASIPYTITATQPPPVCPSQDPRCPPPVCPSADPRCPPAPCQPNDPNCLTPLPVTCEINPNSLTMAQNSFEVVGLTCAQGTQSVTCPANPSWSLAGVSGSITNPSNTGALVEITSAPPASGTLTSILSNGQQCSASITVAQNPPPSGFDCTISPSSFTFRQNQFSSFGLGCSIGGNFIVCPITPTWILSGLTGSLANPSSQGVTALVTSSPPATGQLIAQFSPGHQCISALSVSGPNNQGQSCLITPSSATLTQNTPEQFNLSCNQNGVNIPCSLVKWSNTGISGSFITVTNNNAVFSSPSAVAQSGAINANVSGQFSCSSLISIAGQTNQSEPPGKNVTIGPGGNGCQVSPSTDVLVTGQSRIYTVLCGVNLVPCSATWSVSGSGINQNIVTNGQSVTVTATSTTGINNGQVSANCGQSCSCSASISVIEAICRYYT